MLCVTETAGAPSIEIRYSAIPLPRSFESRHVTGVSAQRRTCAPGNTIVGFFGAVLSVQAKRTLYEEPAFGRTTIRNAPGSPKLSPGCSHGLLRPTGSRISAFERPPYDDMPGAMVGLGPACTRRPAFISRAPAASRAGSRRTSNQ